MEFGDLESYFDEPHHAHLDSPHVPFLAFGIFCGATRGCAVQQFHGAWWDSDCVELSSRLSVGEEAFMLPQRGQCSFFQLHTQLAPEAGATSELLVPMV